MLQQPKLCREVARDRCRERFFRLMAVLAKAEIACEEDSPALAFIGPGDTGPAHTGADRVQCIQDAAHKVLQELIHTSATPERSAPRYA